MQRSFSAQDSTGTGEPGGHRIILTRCAKISYKNGPGRATLAQSAVQTARRRRISSVIRRRTDRRRPPSGKTAQQQLRPPDLSLKVRITHEFVTNRQISSVFRLFRVAFL